MLKDKEKVKKKKNKKEYIKKNKIIYNYNFFSSIL